MILRSQEDEEEVGSEAASPFRDDDGFIRQEAPRAAPGNKDLSVAEDVIDNVIEDDHDDDGIRREAPAAAPGNEDLSVANNVIDDDNFRQEAPVAAPGNEDLSVAEDVIEDNGDNDDDEQKEQEKEEDVVRVKLTYPVDLMRLVLLCPISFVLIVMQDRVSIIDAVRTKFFGIAHYDAHTLYH